FDLRKAHVQFGPQFVGGQRSNLVQQQLSRVQRLLGDMQHRLRLERAEIAGVHLQQNLLAGGGGVLVCGLGLKSGAGREIGGAAEIGDELADGQSTGATVKNARVV